MLKHRLDGNDFITKNGGNVGDNTGPVDNIQTNIPLAFSFVRRCFPDRTQQDGGNAEGRVRITPGQIDNIRDNRTGRR